VAIRLNQWLSLFQTAEPFSIDAYDRSAQLGKLEGSIININLSRAAKVCFILM